MSMKSLSAPRRVYVRNGYLHLLLGGKVFGVNADTSKIVPTIVTSDGSLQNPAKIEVNDDGTITLTQRAPKKKGVTEVWSVGKVPTKPRTSAEI